jgi:hypothetical protein
MRAWAPLLLALLIPAQGWAGPLTLEQRALCAKGSRQDRDGWIQLHLEGDARARGFQHGYLLAPEIQEGLKASRLVWAHRTGTAWSDLLAKAATFFVPAVDSENLQELEAMAEGLAAAGVATTRDELAVYNGFSELIDYWWPQELNRLRNLPLPHHVKEACSAFIAVGSYTAGGGIVMGHNNMSGYENPQANLVVDLVPDRGHRILMQGVPGWIHSGTDFFITDCGLMGCETTIGDFQPYDPEGKPEFARMRRATQDSDNLEAWCETMKRGNNGGYANAWLLGDIRTGVIARLELGLRYVGFQRLTDGYFTGSNLAEDLRILRLETTSKDTDLNQSKVARRVRWRELMEANRGRIDLELAKAFESDHQDVARNENRPGGRSLCAHFDLDPESLWEAPFEPAGTTDAKVVDSAMARTMSFAARYGSACGRAFDAPRFLKDHPQFDWLQGILPSRSSWPWVVFRTVQKPGAGSP